MSEPKFVEVETPSGEVVLRVAGDAEDGLTQTILASPELEAQGVYGNCMQAAIATVLRRPLDAVPHIGAFAWWPGALRLWLRGEGYDYHVVNGPEIPQERAMLVGTSPRGYGHAVVSEHGRIVWDPHPSRDGLTVVKGAYVIHEWDDSEDAELRFHFEADQLRARLERAEAALAAAEARAGEAGAVALEEAAKMHCQHSGSCYVPGLSDRCFAAEDPQMIRAELRRRARSLRAEAGGER